MTQEGKIVGKSHFQHQGEIDAQPRIMVANHAARNSKRVKVGLAKQLGSMVASEKEFQNKLNVMNNQMDEASKKQKNDAQGMTHKFKTVGKPRFELQNEFAQSHIIDNHAIRNSKEREVGVIRELGSMNDNGKGMTRKSRSVGKSHFQLQDLTNTQSRIMIHNHAAGNLKEKVYHAREVGITATSEKDQNVIQIHDASNKNHLEFQGLTSKITSSINRNFENTIQDQTDFMDEEYDQDVDSESESDDAEKKIRGPTFMKEIWGRPSTLPRIKIRCDDMGRPIGSRRNKFTDFLGTLARNGKYCPIDVEGWHKMPLDIKKKMLDVIKEKYDLPPGTESWTLNSIAKKWRNWKSELKKKYYDPELPIQVLLQKRDQRAFAEQYVKLVAHWNTEKSKERSEKNKIARKQKIMNQTTGRRSFAQMQQKLRKKNGRLPSRVELFHACFTHASGSPSSNIVAEKLAAMKELENQLHEDEDDQIGQNDIFAQIMGPDRPGRVRMLGDGVKTTDLWGEVPSRSTCNRIVMEQKTLLEKMDEQIRKQGQHIAMLESKFLSQPNKDLGSNYNNMQHTPSSSSPLLSDPASLSLRIGCSVSLQSLFDSMKIVAKGVVRGMDANIEVGRQMLGPNWCEIQVLVVLEKEESLIRPYDLLQNFGDALGGMIAWPSHLLKVNQEDFY
ncbi:uncharacterized protein [Henckelia pumila]|uniref:uncharacterized protein isoform X3 n=1 Tax=Henckelia pumila TaxID=405737 RepID=UPI003C6DF843